MPGFRMGGGPDVSASVMVDIPTLIRKKSLKEATTFSAGGGSPDKSKRGDVMPITRVSDEIRQEPFPKDKRED